MAHEPSRLSPITTNSFAPGRNISDPSLDRPASSHTLDSTFADSAVDMDPTTPIDSSTRSPKPESNYFESAIPLSPEDVDQSLSDKMRQLAAVAWTLEQDDNMTLTKRQMLHRMLGHLESQLDSAPDETERGSLEIEAAAVNDPSQSHSHDPVAESEPAQDADDEDVWIDESDLIAVRENIAATVMSMRMRQEEQHHLHQLTVHKLEAVAQRCLQQEQKMHELLREVQELRQENQLLGTENDQLRDKLTLVEEEASRNEVAVEAMSSAVTGLEGWIESALPSRAQTPIPVQKTKRQKVVIRGKGRFRGRYYVDEDGDHAVAYSLADAAADGQELHDGVKAWLRGFHDVEEELRNHESPRASRPQGRFRTPEHREADDWGDFQSADQLE